jgi:hypothetical protein
MATNKLKEVKKKKKTSSHRKSQGTWGRSNIERAHDLAEG